MKWLPSEKRQRAAGSDTVGRPKGARSSSRPRSSPLRRTYADTDSLPVVNARCGVRTEMLTRRASIAGDRSGFGVVELVPQDCPDGFDQGVTRAPQPDGAEVFRGLAGHRCVGRQEAYLSGAGQPVRRPAARRWPVGGPAEYIGGKEQHGRPGAGPHVGRQGRMVAAGDDRSCRDGDVVASAGERGEAPGTAPHQVQFEPVAVLAGHRALPEEVFAVHVGDERVVREGAADSDPEFP